LSAGSGISYFEVEILSIGNTWESSVQGKGSNIVLETPLKAIQKKGGSGHSVRALHPLPQTGIVYWEVVFSSPLSRKGGSLGEHCMTGVVNGKEEEFCQNLEWQQDDGEV
jgi:hypothetical protein